MISIIDDDRSVREAVRSLLDPWVMKQKRFRRARSISNLIALPSPNALSPTYRCPG